MPYYYGVPFHIVPFQCCRCFWVLKACCFELRCIFLVWYFCTYKFVKSNCLATMEVLNACVSWNALENQDRYVWTTLWPLKMDGIQIFWFRCSLFDFYAECAHGHMAVRKCGKMITHYFLFKNLSLDEEMQHCCHCFQLWFWRWNEIFSSIMCTW